MRLKHKLVLLLLLFFGNMVIAQTEEHNEEQGHEHNHDHHSNEIGIANAPVYFLKEKEIAYGLHIHYIRQIKGSNFGIGFGYERIFDEHKHNTIGIVGNYRPFDRFVINLSPGVTFEDNESSNMNFALHFETSYEFEIQDFHIGPVIEIAYDPEDYHFSLGLHIGYGF